MRVRCESSSGCFSLKTAFTKFGIDYRYISRIRPQKLSKCLYFYSDTPRFYDTYTHIHIWYLSLFYIIEGKKTLYRSCWSIDVTSVSNLSKTSFIGKIRSVHIIYGTSSRNKGVNITGHTRLAFLSVA